MLETPIGHLVIRICLAFRIWNFTFAFALPSCLTVRRSIHWHTDQRPRLMNLKPQPNHKRYIRVLRSMSDEQRLARAFELSEMTRALFRQGLRERHPGLSEEGLHQLYLERLAKCYNRNY